MAGDARRGRRGRILYSILALLFAVGVVPLVWTSYRLVAASRQSMESDQKEWQLDKARLISTQVATYVDSLRSQVTAIARTLEVDAGATSFAARLERIRADKALERYFPTRKGTHLVYIAVLDPTGKGAQSGLDLRGDEKLQEQLSEAFQRGQHGTPMLSVPVASAALEEPVVVIGEPVRAGDRVEGVVLAVASLQRIREITKATGGGIFEVYVFDNRGRLIAHSDQSRPLAEDMAGVEIVRLFLELRDNQQLLNICQRIVSQVGRRVDESSPICDARLADGSRVNAIVPPLAIDGPALTIRKFKKDKLTLDQLVKFGAITPEGADILQIIGRCRANVLISGGTGSGKTTLLNCLTQYIDDDERIITCEDAAELQLQQPHVVRLETRPPNIEGEGQVTMRELVRNCLRMRPERIIVGEVRGPEAFDLLQAMNTGHDGSMGTLHANNPREALSRCESMITMGGFSLPSRTIREMICASIDVVIQAARLRDGSRRITHITEVMGMEGDTIITQDLFIYDMVGEDANGHIIGRHRSTGIGRPRFWDRARYYGEEKRLAAALDAAEVVVEV